jgi:signal recognition particle subunit SRP19
MLTSKRVEKRVRKQEKIIMWPAYFDSTRTRKDGRQAPKNLAVPSPKILEIKDAVERIGLECELMSDAAYPRTPWLKNGALLVKKTEAKNQMLRRIGKQLVRMRSVAGTK